MGSAERFWTRRLRWRLRGAWQWPTFALLTVGDGLVLHLLPPSRTGFALAPGLIVASFGNLILVGAVAPWLVRRLRERARRTPAGTGAAPPEVTLDRVATALMAAGFIGLVAAGLAARPLVVSETEATEDNARLVSDYVHANGSPEVRRNLDTANTIRLEENYFRTCIALDDRRRAFCLFVDTDAEPPVVREDPSPLPNAQFTRGARAR